MEPTTTNICRDESEALINDPSPILEEKLDGTNVGIHFTTAGRIVLQCPEHEITDGIHPQYDLFKTSLWENEAELWEMT